MPGIGNKVNLIPSNSKTSEATATAFPHEVSQSVPQSGLSPVMAKYKQYLQSCYKARVLAPADKYLPTLESPYINLAMIRRGCYTHEQRDEFTRRTLHGGVDQILERKTPINIEDLLTPEDKEESYRTRVKGGDWLICEGSESPISVNKENFKNISDSEYGEFHQALSLVPVDIDWHTLMVPHNSKVPITQRAVHQVAESKKKPVRFILVEGPPGIGKSTFAWEVCRRWDEIEGLRDYHTVVLLKLREKWVLNVTSLSDLFRYEYDPNMSKCISLELAKTQGSSLLLVLDGFDEVSHSFHKKSVIKSILCRQLLPECTIILSTRPVAMYALRSICQPRVDKHVEIIGFTEEERVRYITKVFSKEPELQVNFLKYMFLVPHIKSMMYIPLNCAIIAQVYYESQSSHHVAIPRTRTQLYKALTHSLLVRHMKTNKSNGEYTSMLPEGLDKKNSKIFKTLAKFAFDAYHKGELRKVTFFKEDIPKGLVHFGFMNESTEMYAGKGMEQTFSFLHLSLQEYLAAWHLADSYSIEFQVAYHRLALEPYDIKDFEGDKDEKALISQLSLRQQSPSLVEPAIFLAGITGWRCQSENDRNHWEMYLSHDSIHVSEPMVLLQSLYEAQNPTLLSHYYAVEKSDDRRMISIGSFESSVTVRAPYDCYALSYCLANSSDEFSLSIGISGDDEVALVETFFKGLNDHHTSTTPRVAKLKIRLDTDSVKNSNRCLYWLAQASCWTDLKAMEFGSKSSVYSDLAQFLKKLIKLQFIFIHIPSWEWLPSLKYLGDCQLKGFNISNNILHMPQNEPLKQPGSTSISHHLQDDNCWRKAILDIEFPSSTIRDDVNHSINVGINSLLKSVQRLNQITMMDLSNISRETMAGVHNILLHCPSLTTLELKRTRLGYDGILYICSALRNNTTLRHLEIHDSLQLSPFSDCVTLPVKSVCTNILLELSNIVKDNTLKKLNIQSNSLYTRSGHCQETVFGLKLYEIRSDVAFNVLQTLVKLQSLKNIRYCKWLASPKSFKHLQELHISNQSEHSLKVNNQSGPGSAVYIEFPTTAITSDQSNTVDKRVDMVLQLVLQLKKVSKISLSDISRETMAGVHNILLHCPSLITLELKRTRLGYDGILYICNTLRNNTTLRHLLIHDSLQLSPFSDRVTFPVKSICTSLLLELSNIVKDNTLKKLNIQSGSFNTSGHCQDTVFGLKLYQISSDVAFNVLQTLIKLLSLKNVRYCKWLASPESFKHLQELHISNQGVVGSITNPPFWGVTPFGGSAPFGSSIHSNQLGHESEVNILYIEFPATAITSDQSNTDEKVDLVLQLVLQLNTFSKFSLSDISRETMAGVHNILLHCPSLTTLELKRTRLGYDGILYICSALRNNTTLRHLEIHNRLPLSPSRKCAILPGEMTPNDLLLELSHIVKENTLSVMDIRSDSLSSGEEGRIIFDLKFYNISSDIAHDALEALVKIPKSDLYCQWLASPESLKHLQELNISNKSTTKSTKSHAGLTPVRAYSQNVTNSSKYKAVLNIEFPSNTKTADLCNSVVDLFFQFNIVKVVFSNISRETMAGVHNILLHCPSVTTLKLMGTRLGYDGILYICSALRNNTTLTHLVIRDDLQLPPYNRKVTLSMERDLLPGKTTCTDFLLELNNILKDNTTLEKMKIQSGLFLPLSAGEDGEYCQWTGLGPLQQFNVGAVGSGMSPNLRRSFSSSDLTQPRTTTFWVRPILYIYGSAHKQVDFKELFSKRKEEGKKLFSLPSFTAPDTEVLQSFSGLDPRLKECLKISHLHQYVERLRETFSQLMIKVVFLDKLR